MVEKIKNSKVRFNRTTGPIRLSVDNLVDYLSNTQIFESTTFEATCNGYRFNSVDDMKENRELLAGRPSIYGKFENGYSLSYDFTIEFDEGAIINAYSVSEDRHLAILEKASTNINTHRGPLWVFKYFPLDTVWMLWGLFLGGNLLFLCEISAVSKEGLMNSYPARILCLLFFVSFFRSLVSKRNPVYFGVKSQLLEKLKENALTHIIVFALGICLTWLVTKIGLIQ